MEKSWKISRDPYYSDLYDKYGYDFIVDAGFFEDTAKENVNILESLDILCTPINFINRTLRSRSVNKPIYQNDCIILSTGSFCPIHKGHIEMMEHAKSTLEANGWNVIGGYLSPGHDEYISSKAKDKAIPVNYRIQIINEMIKDIHWLSVDPWEGVFAGVAVNFTDVVYRLEKYIEKHIGRHIPIFFVCGGDNARFASTFKDKGHCVVIDRPGYGERCYNYLHLQYTNRIYFGVGNNDMSSTKIREQNVWIEPDKKELQLRVDGNLMDEPLIEILKPYFTKINQRIVSEQIDNFFRDNDVEKIINLDTMIPSMYQLGISRKYDLFGMTKLGYTERPGYPSFKTQLEKIDKSKSYYIFDDDIHSGGTMRFTNALLKHAGIKVDGIKSLVISTPDESEILDARDFYIGFDNSGLVVEYPDYGKFRVPYIYPFVDPTSSCSISNPMQFSIDVWKMNYDFWKVREVYELNDLPFMLKLYRDVLGFPADIKICDICEHYYKLLLNLRNK